eukprot:TRINITY_DN55574_c0_g1_i1.p1 TRINITY_DN55574_c0_g1~~TRINITY_DN55574_c0_g1_i1.p1  ORF type:complete len:951 (-),score=144.07 TRINITY_DN55574_c0_g1_i1:34-2886(-)
MSSTVPYQPVDGASSWASAKPRVAGSRAGGGARVPFTLRRRGPLPLNPHATSQADSRSSVGIRGRRTGRNLRVVRRLGISRVGADVNADVASGNDVSSRRRRRPPTSGGRERDRVGHVTGGGATNFRGDSGTTTTVFYHKAPARCTDKELLRFFGQAGEVRRIRVFRNLQTGMRRGTGICEFASSEEAAAAVESLDGKVLKAVRGSTKLARSVRVQFHDDTQLSISGKRRQRAVPQTDEHAAAAWRGAPGGCGVKGPHVADKAPASNKPSAKVANAAHPGAMQSLYDWPWSRRRRIEETAPPQANTEPAEATVPLERVVLWNSALVPPPPPRGRPPSMPMRIIGPPPPPPLPETMPEGCVKLPPELIKQLAHYYYIGSEPHSASSSRDELHPGAVGVLHDSKPNRPGILRNRRHRSGQRNCRSVDEERVDEVEGDQAEEYSYSDEEAEEAWEDRADLARGDVVTSQSISAGTTIFFHNVPFDLSEKDLRPTFERAGDVRRLDLHRDSGGRFQGQGTCVYSTIAAASKALELLSGYRVEDAVGGGARALQVEMFSTRQRLSQRTVPRVASSSAGAAAKAAPRVDVQGRSQSRSRGRRGKRVAATSSRQDSASVTAGQMAMLQRSWQRSGEDQRRGNVAAEEAWDLPTASTGASRGARRSASRQRRRARAPPSRSPEGDGVSDFTVASSPEPRRARGSAMDGRAARTSAGTKRSGVVRVVGTQTGVATARGGLGEQADLIAATRGEASDVTVVPSDDRLRRGGVARRGGGRGTGHGRSTSGSAGADKSNEVREDSCSDLVGTFRSAASFDSQTKNTQACDIPFRPPPGLELSPPPGLDSNSAQLGTAAQTARPRQGRGLGGDGATRRRWRRVAQEGDCEEEAEAEDVKAEEGESEGEISRVVRASGGRTSSLHSRGGIARAASAQGGSKRKNIKVETAQRRKWSKKVEVVGD